MAVGGGVLLIIDPGGGSLHLSTAWLEHTPFTNYRVPGFLLLILVGGVNGLALFYQMTRNRASYVWTLAGAVLLLGWTLIQMLIFDGVSWLQMLYLFTGLCMVLLTWQLKGKWAA